MASRYHSIATGLLGAALVGGVAGLALPAAAAPGLVGDLYVSGDISNHVLEFQGTTGAYQGIFCIPVGSSGAMSVHFNAAGTRMLVGSTSGGVEERDATTGAWIKTYAPAGGWQWGALYAPNGNVFIGSITTNDVREYNSVTGALVQFICPVLGPADMRIGPNGNLYICSYGGGFVLEVNATNGNFVSTWALPFGALANDIAFLPNGEILVTAMRTDVVYRYDAAHNLLGSFSNAFWGNPHGIVLSPWNGHILVSDGVTGQVHEFDPVTFAEINAAFLVPPPGDKIVDLEFRPGGGPVPVTPLDWGSVKQLFR
jgi:streptogramin lyase